MNETDKIANLLQSKTIIDNLYGQLSEILDYNKLPYEIGFIPSEYYQFNKELKAAPYTPKYKYLIEGVPKSKEVDLPANIMRVTTMLRPTRASLKRYFETLSMFGVLKVYIQPFLDGYTSNLSIFNEHIQGGVIVRIGDIKQSDLGKAVE